MKSTKHVALLATAFIASAFLAGCATTVDLAKYHDADLKEAQIMPTQEQLKQQRIKIVVFEADEGGVTNAVNSQLGGTFARAVEKDISAAGGEVVDRVLAVKLRDELMLAENGGAGSYKGPQVAQYAIRGKVNSAEYGASYVSPSSWRDKEGKDHYNPGYYKHEAKMTGTLNLYELPGLRLVKAINLQGSSSATDPNTGANHATGASLLRAATNSAISNQGHQIKNLIAPKGYVVERRTDGDKSIFKVLMGHGQGVKPEDKVVIYSLRKKTNALTGKEQIDEMPVVEAKISDKVSDEESWIIPDNKDAAALIRLGDFVKVKYEERSFLSKMTD